MAFKAVPGGLRLAVRLTPKAARAAVLGCKPRADGGEELCIAVTAPPDKGKANDALLALLAKRLGIAASRLEIVAGATDRRKQVLLHGDPADWTPKLAALCALKE